MVFKELTLNDKNVEYLYDCLSLCIGCRLAANNDGQQTLRDMLHILESQKKYSDLILLGQANITDFRKYIVSSHITL